MVKRGPLKLKMNLFCVDSFPLCLNIIDAENPHTTTSAFRFIWLSDKYTLLLQ